LMVFIPFSIEKIIFLCSCSACLSHIASRSPIESNAYFVHFMATAVTDADLYRFLTFHLLNPMTIFHCVGCSEGSAQVRSPLLHIVTCFVLTVRNC
jgi:hypothetical protein